MDDYNETCKKLESMVSDHARDCKRLLDANSGETTLYNPFDGRRFEAAEKKMLDATEKLRTLQGCQRPIGKVIASSGFCAREFEEHNIKVKRKIDWAIVEVDDKSRFSHVKAPATMRISSAKDDLPHDGPYDPPLPSEPTSETAWLELGEWVFMRGRTSGYKTGTVNFIAMENSVTQVDVGPHQEMIVISTRPGLQFSDAGDSGSFIFNRKGQVVAMQVSQRFPIVQNGAHYTGVTPIRSLFTDILQQTKAMPRLPTEKDMQGLSIGWE